MLSKPSQSLGALLCAALASGLARADGPIESQYDLTFAAGGTTAEGTGGIRSEAASAARPKALPAASCAPPVSAGCAATPRAPGMQADAKPVAVQVAAVAPRRDALACAGVTCAPGPSTCNCSEANAHPIAHDGEAQKRGSNTGSEPARLKANWGIGGSK